jgi:hypothetical protein
LWQLEEKHLVIFQRGILVIGIGHKKVGSLAQTAGELGTVKPEAALACFSGNGLLLTGSLCLAGDMGRIRSF